MSSQELEQNSNDNQAEGEDSDFSASELQNTNNHKATR